MANEQEVSQNEEKAETSTTSDKPVNGTTNAGDPELLKKIKNQVEFYFGDVNMQRDKFLIEQVKLDNGWVPMTVMLNFKLLASLSKDTDVILKALESSDLIEISEDKKSIRRSPKYPLPVYNEEYRKAQEARTVYLKGFSQTETTMEMLKEFFDQFEPYENIVMRKYLDKDKKLHFKGSVFVQFKTLEDAQAFMARESVKYKNEELIRKWSKDYTVEHQKEVAERREAKKNKKAKKQNQGEENKTNDTNEKTESSKEDSIQIDLPKGAIVYFQGGPLGLEKHHIKDLFNDQDIAYIDILEMGVKGYIRLRGENSAKNLYEKLKDGKFTVMNTSVTCQVLTGEEEEKYLEKTRQALKEKIMYTRSRYGKKGTKKMAKKRRAASPASTNTPAKITAVAE